MFNTASCVGAGVYGKRQKSVKTAFKILIDSADTPKNVADASRIGCKTHATHRPKPIYSEWRFQDYSRRMILFCRRLLVAFCVTGLSGCHPQFTRVPDLIPRTSAQDKSLWNYHNPFPDETVAPSVDHRPAGSELQRTMPRQAIEKDSMTFHPRGAFEPPRPEARLNPKTANVVQP